MKLKHNFKQKKINIKKGVKPTKKILFLCRKLKAMQNKLCVFLLKFYSQKKNYNFKFFSKLTKLAFNDKFTQVFEQVAQKKTKNFSFFLDKLRNITAVVNDLRVFYIKEKPRNFEEFLKHKKLTESQTVDLLFKLVNLMHVVEGLNLKIKKKFSTKFVGLQAFRVVNKYLNTYLYIYEYWLEFERMGVFNQMISYKNIIKLLRYLWFDKKSSYFYKQPLWKSVCSDQNFLVDFRRILQGGFSMSCLKLTDDLFFWHAFTRKRILQNMWLFRSKKVFSKLHILKQHKHLSKQVLSAMFKKANKFSILLNFSNLKQNYLFFFEKKKLVLKPLFIKLETRLKFLDNVLFNITYNIKIINIFLFKFGFSLSDFFFVNFSFLNNFMLFIKNIKLLKIFFYFSFFRVTEICTKYLLCLYFFRSTYIYLNKLKIFFFDLFRFHKKQKYTHDNLVFYDNFFKLILTLTKKFDDNFLDINSISEDEEAVENENVDHASKK